MRLIGTSAFGVRLPIIGKGDNLPEIVAERIASFIEKQQLSLCESDVIGVTEAIVAKAQGNYASISDLSLDVKRKFPSGTVGVVFPIMSRNRFLNILRGIAMGAERVAVLLNYPNDEVGNPIADIRRLDEIEDKLKPIFTGEEFKTLTNDYKHPFTGVNYIDLYKSISDNIDVYVSSDPKTILTITDQIIAADIHSRFITKKRLLNAGAKTVCTLSDLLTETINGSGFNPDFGVLGSNLSTDEMLKLFPRDCNEFVETTRNKIFEKCGVRPELLIYGDGAFKDPLYGIWELADPVVSPAFSERLGGQPKELKLKYIADNVFAHLSEVTKSQAITDMIKTKSSQNKFSEGTTPRKYADLLGSLCDLMSGSGDKGTPVILIKGYFDDFASE